MIPLARAIAILLLMSSPSYAAGIDINGKNEELRAKLFSEGKVSISGVVKQQGEYPVGPGISLVEAIAKAGGVDARGWKKALLTRGDRVYVLNNNKEDGTFALKAGDLVHVAPSCWGP